MGQWFYKTPEIHYDQVNHLGRPFFYYAYGAAVSEVAIDTLTGEMQVLRADILHDVGRSINPAIDIGQIEGGFVQGMGWLTTEELYWQPQVHTHSLFTHAPSTYKIPTSVDIPHIFNVKLFNNQNQADTIYRSKAVGEPPFMLALSVSLQFVRQYRRLFQKMHRSYSMLRQLPRKFYVQSRLDGDKLWQIAHRLKCRRLCNIYNGGLIL